MPSGRFHTDPEGKEGARSGLEDPPFLRECILPRVISAACLSDVAPDRLRIHFDCDVNRGRRGAAMRIIAGLYRGRLLKSLKGSELRPTSDRLRETLFDVLGAGVEGSVFVDCYAGSGAVGLEALSRGARQVILIEQNSAADRLILANLSSLGVRPEVELVRAPVGKGLRLLEKRGIRADLCFLDPPYSARTECSASLLWLSGSSLMAPQGLIIVEHPRKKLPEEKFGSWSRFRLLAQGSSALSFYRAAQPEPGSLS